ncbi:alpha/beta fold hydrolase [Desulfosudis oleivorans]|uniref:Alpha/beta hydrolase fold n=1 Tax=Desulfosudis oleivorans (strain DSM 6200 / JCM 39069 / Hxd3) TaxID=96561 RepID=A8ZY33_DESOH|nr:alpha/beta fold hydrolase [Desulfosudis oleivorans]ABW67040.1 alpha/beta hydrolase fold [Desulfosudis oleivorans Hxd3]
MEHLSEKGFSFIAEPWPMVPGRPVVVCVHGAGMSGYFWVRQVQGLSPVANMVAIDLPGHGGNRAAGADTVEAYAGHVLAFVEALGFDRPVLCGHSMGGAVTQHLLAHHPGRFTGGILANTGARLKVLPLVFETLQKGMQAFADLTLATAICPQNKTDETEQIIQNAAVTDPAVAIGDFNACNTFDLMNRIGEIAVPVLVIGAADDLSTPAKYAAFLADRIPGARLKMVESAGHMAPLEKPDEINAAVSDFLKEVLHKGGDSW